MGVWLISPFLSPRALDSDSDACVMAGATVLFAGQKNKPGM
jgi:hypothetical protein